MSQNKRYIISLGGSLIVPDEIDINFLKQFKKLILARVAKKEKFILITGGGKTSRRYSLAAKNLGDLNPNDLDWLGIHATRLNGHLMRTIFRKVAHNRIIKNPNQFESTNEPVVIAAGYRPGWSTDYVAVLLAKKYKADAVLNLSDVDYVYDKDPGKFKNAKKIEKMSWQDFRKIAGNKWDPGLNSPFDPIASKLAEKLNLQVTIMNGRNFKNLENYFVSKKFKGTVIG